MLTGHEQSNHDVSNLVVLERTAVAVLLVQERSNDVVLLSLEAEISRQANQFGHGFSLQS